MDIFYQISHLTFNVIIPYSCITDIENPNNSKILTILYNDGKEEETLIIDFGANIKYAHPIIYGKFKEAAE